MIRMIRIRMIRIRIRTTEAKKWNLGSAFLFLGLLTFPLLVSLGLHLVVVGPKFLPAVEDELGALAVKLADLVEDLLDEEAGVADARFSEKQQTF